MKQTPTRMDHADEATRMRFANALAHHCSACGAKPGRWCFTTAGVWTLHGERLLAWSNVAE